MFAVEVPVEVEVPVKVPVEVTSSEARPHMNGRPAKGSTVWVRYDDQAFQLVCATGLRERQNAVSTSASGCAMLRTGAGRWPCTEKNHKISSDKIIQSREQGGTEISPHCSVALRRVAVPVNPQSVVVTENGRTP